MLERRRTLFHAAQDFDRARLCPHFVQTEGARLPFALHARRLNSPQSPPALFARARRFVARRIRKERVREKCVGRGRGVQNKAERGRKSAPLRFVCEKKGSFGALSPFCEDDRRKLRRADEHARSDKDQDAHRARCPGGEIDVVVVEKQLGKGEK